MNIDVPMHELAQRVTESLKQYQLPVVLTVMRSIGKIIETQLAQNKGVKLDKFGSFSYGLSGEPVFYIASDFATQYNLKVKSVPAEKDSQAIISKLNYLQLAKYSNIDREAAEKIYKRLIEVIGRVINEKKSLLLNLKAAEIVISNNELSCTFTSPYVLTGEGSNVDTMKLSLQAHQTLKTGIQRSLLSAAPRQEDGDEAPTQFRRRSMSAAPLHRDRDRNPITGEGDREAVREIAPRERARNPIMESVDDSAAAAVATASFGRRRGDIAHPGSTSRRVLPGRPSTAGTVQSVGSAGGFTPRLGSSSNSQLRRENLAALGHQRTSARPVARGIDPRAAAASALGTENVLQRIREKIVQRGGSSGIKGLAKLLSIMDDNGDKRLSKDELKYGLRDYGIDLSSSEIDEVFRYFDRDRNGFVDITEFLVGIKGDLNARRKQLVGLAFASLDRDGSGLVTVDELLEVYDFGAHPEVVSGKKTKKEAMREFMAQWDRDGGGTVTLDEFLDYYKDVSASIDGDDYFELMIRNAWRIAGGEGVAANTANKRVLVTNKDGSQSVATVNNELGVRPGDRDGYGRRLAQQGVEGDIELHGGVDTTEKAKNATGRPTGASTNSARRPSSVQATLGSKITTTASSSSSSLKVRTSFNASEVLQRLLYTPPLSLEQLAARLQVSIVSDSPRVTKVAFITKILTLDSSLSKTNAQTIWDLIDTNKASVLELTAVHGYLAGRFGKDKSSKGAGSVIERVIARIRERAAGSGGIKGLSRVLAIMDNSGDKKLSKEELKYGLADYGIELNLREVDDIFSYFDRDRNGFVDITEFLVGIKGDLNARRKQLVGMAFTSLDRDGSGLVTVDELLEVYDFGAHPEVVSGKKTKKEAMREFMAQWDRDGGGTVTLDEFLDYYKDVSASIDGDDYFDLMIRNAWRIAGGEGVAANTVNKRVLVTNKDGSQSVATVNNELGVRPGDRDGYRRRLAQQGVEGDIELHGGLDTTEKAKTSKGFTGSSRSRQQQPSTGAAPSKSAPLFERNVAAAKLAAAYRGRMGRKVAATEQRKAVAVQRTREEEVAEARIPRPQQVVRPKGNSYIGF